MLIIFPYIYINQVDPKTSRDQIQAGKLFGTSLIQNSGVCLPLDLLILLRLQKKSYDIRIKSLSHT